MKKLKDTVACGLDWLLILLPMIVTYSYFWYTSVYPNIEMGGGAMTLTTIEAVAIFVPAMVTVLGFILKYVFADRKQYKDIISRLGEFRQINLEGRIGNTSGTGSLVAQHQAIQSSVAQAQTALTASLREAETHIGVIETTVREEKLIREEREKYLNSREIDGRVLHDALDSLTQKLQNSSLQQGRLQREIDRLHGEVTELRRENDRLREKIHDLTPMPPHRDYDLDR